MKCRYLRDELAAALETAWEDVNRFWGLVEIFADDVQEECEVAADGFRWLCAIRQRPHVEYHANEWICWWFRAGLLTWAVANWQQESINCHLPDTPFSHPTWVVEQPRENRVALFEWAVQKWVTATPETRIKLWDAARPLVAATA